ncbi:MAG: thioredoxin family protein [Chlorobium sp.]|uniref:thioredoxin family protein n=1 Tax=Chlorobium sp. TaxID=1095 RepID=UPI002F413687
MKQVKILGTGCAKCNQLADAVKAVIASEGIDAEVEKVEDIQKIMAYNVLSTPALVVDGEVRSKGRVPEFDELKKLLADPVKKGGCCCGSQSGSSNGAGRCC